jgi:hypothetical protein
MTLWEIHPVIEVYLCDDGGACDATRADGWTRLE